MNVNSLRTTAVSSQISEQLWTAVHLMYHITKAPVTIVSKHHAAIKSCTPWKRSSLAIPPWLSVCCMDFCLTIFCLALYALSFCIPVCPTASGSWRDVTTGLKQLSNTAFELEHSQGQALCLDLLKWRYLPTDVSYQLLPTWREHWVLFLWNGPNQL